jgi:hypothetical protein
MSEDTEKKRRNQTAKSRTEDIYDRYLRMPTGESYFTLSQSLLNIPSENELRAIEEFPLGKFDSLNDRSENGKRIWRLLETSERTRDVSVLEEAGRLLWEQVMSRPESTADSSPSPPRGIPGIRSTPLEGRDRTQLHSHINATSIIPSGRSKDGNVNRDKGGHKNRDRGAVESGERAVDCRASVKDGEPEYYREWDNDAFMPAKKRTKLTYAPSGPQDIQSRVSSFTNQGYEAPGPASGGHDHAPTLSKTPTRHDPMYNTIHQELPTHPHSSDALADSQMSNSQSSDQLSLPSSPSNLQSPEIFTIDGLSEGASRYFGEQGNRERPQPYAPGNFSTYISFKGV